MKAIPGRKKIEMSGVAAAAAASFGIGAVSGELNDIAGRARAVQGIGLVAGVSLGVLLVGGVAIGLCKKYRDRRNDASRGERWLRAGLAWSFQPPVGEVSIAIVSSAVVGLALVISVFGNLNWAVTYVLGVVAAAVVNLIVRLLLPG